MKICQYNFGTPAGVDRTYNSDIKKIEQKTKYKNIYPTIISHFLRMHHHQTFSFSENETENRSMTDQKNKKMCCIKLLGTQKNGFKNLEHIVLKKNILFCSGLTPFQSNL